MCSTTVYFSIHETGEVGWATLEYEHDRPFELHAVIHVEGDEASWKWSLEALSKALEGTHIAGACIQMYLDPKDSSTLIIHLQDSDGLDNDMRIAFDRSDLSVFCSRIVIVPEDADHWVHQSLQQELGI